MNGIIKEITEVNNNSQEIIYVGIGCASNLDVKKIDKLKLQNNHQYPNFLRRFNKVKRTLILVDSLLDEIPYCIKHDFSNSKYIIKPRDDYVKYELKDENIDIYVLCELFYNNNINDLRVLNNYCITNRILLFVHKFTGEDTGELAYYFDEELKDNKDLIMYDISLRTNYGCYIDMINCINNPIIEFIKDEYIIFNPFNKTNKELLDIYKETNNKNKKKQIKKYFNVLFNEFLKNYTVLRQIHIQVLNCNNKKKYNFDKIYGLDNKLDNLLYDFNYTKIKIYENKLLDSLLKQLFNGFLVKYDLYNLIDSVIDGYTTDIYKVKQTVLNKYNKYLKLFHLV